MKRIIENSKSEQKLEVIRLWKNGLGISAISKQMQVTRQTVYRWVSEVEEGAARSSKRNRFVVDEKTKMRVIECFILMKRPSMSELKTALASFFHIHLSESQLNRYLKKWGLRDFRPSPLFDNIKKVSIRQLIDQEKSFDAFRAQKNSQSDVAHL